MTLPAWLAAEADRLAAQTAAGTLPHALLVTGPPGWGEIVLANWLALTLLALDPERDASQLAHPDLRWVVRDGAEIKVDTVRGIAEFAQRTPQSGERKVVVLVDADALNQNAANALLKTLEEPPAGTYLILTTTRPARLLATVRSRCQRRVIAPDRALARHWLTGGGIAEAELERRLFEHGGAPLAVAAALESGEALLEPVLLEALRPGSRPAAHAALHSGDLVANLGRWYRYAAALAAGGWQPPALAGVSTRAVAAFVDELTWVRRQLLTSNSANGRVLTEHLLARWRTLAQPPSRAAV
jgi:DNA polymerase III subunit delta'